MEQSKVDSTTRKLVMASIHELVRFEVAHFGTSPQRKQGKYLQLSGFYLRKLDKLSIPSLALRACISTGVTFKI